MRARPTGGPDAYQLRAPPGKSAAGIVFSARHHRGPRRECSAAPAAIFASDDGGDAAVSVW